MYVTERMTTARREIAHNAKQKGVLPLIELCGMQRFYLQGATAAPCPPAAGTTGSGIRLVACSVWWWFGSCIHNQTHCRLLWRQVRSWIVNAVATPGKIPRTPRGGINPRRNSDGGLQKLVL